MKTCAILAVVALLAGVCANFAPTDCGTPGDGAACLCTTHAGYIESAIAMCHLPLRSQSGNTCQTPCCGGYNLLCPRACILIPQCVHTATVA